MVDVEAIGQNITAIYKQLGPEEQRRYTRQIDIKY
jgi:hypothetical protein